MADAPPLVWLAVGGLAAWIAAGVAPPARAVEATPPALPRESLAQEAEDPTASLMALQIADWYTLRHHNLDDEDANAIVLRPVVPFATGSLNHILRVTMPFVTDSPVLGSGLSDTTVFDLLVFDQRWGRWGVGPVTLLPTGGAARGAQQWALGPAAGFTTRTGGLLWGLFNQNLLRLVGDDDRDAIYVSSLQPILNYALGRGWTVGSSEMSVTYDWRTGRWASIPLGGKVSKLVRPGGFPVQLQTQYEHDFADDQVGPRDTLRFTVKFLFPVG